MKTMTKKLKEKKHKFQKPNGNQRELKLFKPKLHKYSCGKLIR